ncbi:hypothetical protein PsW64_02379 [Pseudovibrio sp. W64]|uniref:hypothetical protein n=1 Tax=Pseudovibrio sp. W64 TaxID=1735583 RepID=UPI0007AEBB1A|nr:hypothetical protein [Pseudovibrio sp. W64]KZK81790.1 hypothetical protein PsW64_02379 [Pseudovibrio sp. W64]
MSLARIALRHCAVEALKTAGTLVGANILDSKVAALQVSSDGSLRTDEEGPFIAVYTDVSNSGELGGRSLRVNGHLDLVFNFGITAAMTQTNEKGESVVVGLEVPATSPNFELFLDALTRQIKFALLDPQNPWSELLKGFAPDFRACEELRHGNARDGVRLVSGQLRLTVELVADPVPGAALPEAGIWSRFLAKLAESDPEQCERLQGLLAWNGREQDDRLSFLHGLSGLEADALKLTSASKTNPSATFSSEQPEGTLSAGSP